MAKSMCVFCNRAPHQPHLQNCPALTGVLGLRKYTPFNLERKRGVYLRRSRNAPIQGIYPNTIFLVEIKPEQDSPAEYYRNMYLFKEKTTCPGCQNVRAQCACDHQAMIAVLTLLVP